MSQVSLGTEQELPQDKKNKLITLKNLDWHKNSGTGGMRQENVQSRDMASRDSHGSYLQRVATEKGNINQSGILSSTKDDGETNFDAGSVLAHSNTQVVLEPMKPSRFKPPQIIEEHPVPDKIDISPKANYMQGAPEPMKMTSNFGGSLSQQQSRKNSHEN